MTPQFTLPIQPIHKRNRTLGNLESHRLRTHHHLHLETIPLAHSIVDNLLQHILLVQPKAPSQVAHTGHQHDISDEVRRARRELAEQVPAVHPALNIAATRIPRPADNVRVRLLLDLDHRGYELGMMAEVGVHDDHEIARGELQPVDVRRSESEFARARLEDDVLGAPESLQLFRDFERAVRRAVVDNDHFPV